MKKIHSFLKVAVCLAVMAVSAVFASAAASDFTWSISPSPEYTQKQIYGVYTINIPSLDDDGIIIARPRVILELPDGSAKGYQLNIGDTPGQLKFNVTDKFTESGIYVFTIEGGCLYNGWTGKELPEITFSYTVDSKMTIDGNIVVEPSLDGDKLEGTYTITLLDYAEHGLKPCTTVRPTNVLLYKANDVYGKLVKYWRASTSKNKISFTVDPGFGEAGEYVLVLDDWVDAKTEEDISVVKIPFTLTGAYIPEPEPEPEPVIDWTYVVTPDPNVTVSEFPKRIYVQWPGIKEINNFSSLITITGPNNYSNTTTRMKSCYRLTEGPNAGVANMAFIDSPAVMPPAKGEYTITIPKNTVMDEATEIFCKEPIEFKYTVGSTQDVIDAIGDKAKVSIYRLNGTAVAVDADADAVRGLAPGYYVINGKTYYIQ